MTAQRRGFDRRKSQTGDKHSNVTRDTPEDRKIPRPKIGGQRWWLKRMVQILALAASLHLGAQLPAARGQQPGSTAEKPNANKRSARALATSIETSQPTMANDDELLSASLEHEELSPPEVGRRAPARPRDAYRLRIVHILAPEVTQNGTQNVTLDCMFNFNKNLDQRLTIKWFFNDELEPIYQWIPELNKRVYSDKYEKYIDKSYEVRDDLEFMLAAYKQLSTLEPAAIGHPFQLADGGEGANLLRGSEIHELSEGRALLASRLDKLAKLGGHQSRQLIESLRHALFMEDPEFSRFRALRLVMPSVELGGRFTCSVSSLDSDDIRSTNLIIYEPARSFNFSASKVSPSHYNLSCQADGVFPRPQLALSRFRAGTLKEAEQGVAEPSQRRAPAQRQRPRLAATLLRQEPLSGVHFQVWRSPDEPRDLENTNELEAPTRSQPSSYAVSSWALVDEASLASNLLSQFECQLTIEGAGYEQRQSLALQRGWHANSAALSSKQTLVGLLSALASLLCLMLALVSTLLIFRLLRRNTKRRVHQARAPSPQPDYEKGGPDASPNSGASPATSQDTSDYSANDQIYKQPPRPKSLMAADPEGVYRIPEPRASLRAVGYSAAGRQMGALLAAPIASSSNARLYGHLSRYNQQSTNRQQARGMNHPGQMSSQPLYC